MVKLLYVGSNDSAPTPHDAKAARTNRCVALFSPYVRLNLAFGVKVCECRSLIATPHVEVKRFFRMFRQIFPLFFQNSSIRAQLS